MLPEPATAQTSLGFACSTPRPLCFSSPRARNGAEYDLGLHMVKGSWPLEKHK
jgi:hypothetical protein